MRTTERVAEYLKTADLARVRAADMARHLCMSETKMRRHLVSEGNNFAGLLREERKRRVVGLLARNPHADAWKVSDTCGFVTRKNITREFCLWFGCNFREYRRSLA